jgi:hypothetical protein
MALLLSIVATRMTAQAPTARSTDAPRAAFDYATLVVQQSRGWIKDQSTTSVAYWYVGGKLLADGYPWKVVGQLTGTPADSVQHRAYADRHRQRARLGTGDVLQLS